MIHAEGCPGGRTRASYGRDRAPRYRCSHCRALQGVNRGPRIGAYLGTHTGRHSGAEPNRSNEPRSLVQRALDRLRLS